MTGNLGPAWAVGGSFVTLELILFEAHGENTLASIEGLRRVVAAVPDIMASLFAAVLWIFCMTQAQPQTLREEIKAPGESQIL